MKTPARSAAEIMSSPGSAETARPSTVMEIPAGASTRSATVHRVGRERATALFDVHEQLVGEHLGHRDDRRGDGRAEHADRRLLRRPGEPGRDVVAGVEHEIDVL